MEINEFKDLIKDNEPLELAKQFLYQDSVFAISSKNEYERFLDEIRVDYSDNEHISIVGSGNWKYSLNPEKGLFREFNRRSDVDIVIISRNYFDSLWERLRDFHRNRYYSLSFHAKEKLKRNGQNVYSGFITPKWIPNPTSPLRLEYEININKYSNKSIGYRSVNMMFFKNEEEVLDYYVRGFRIAKRRIIRI